MKTEERAEQREYVKPTPQQMWEEEKNRFGHSHSDYICFLRWLNRIDNNDPEDEVLDIIRQKEEGLQQHLEGEKTYGHNKGKRIVNLYLVDELASKIPYTRSSQTRDFSITFLERNLARIEQGILEGEVLLGEDMTCPDPKGSAICLKAISTVLKHGSPIARQQAYDILSRNAGQFTEDLDNWNNRWPSESTLEAILYNSLPPQNEAQQRLAILREFIFLVAPLGEIDYGSFSDSDPSIPLKYKRPQYSVIYPYPVIHFWGKKFLAGEVSAEQLREVAQNLILVNQTSTQLYFEEFDLNKDHIKKTRPELVDKEIDRNLKHHKRFRGDQIRELFQKAFLNPNVLNKPEDVIKMLHTIMQFLQPIRNVYEQKTGVGTDYFTKYKDEAIEVAGRYLSGRGSLKSLNEYHTICKAVAEIKEVIRENNPGENKTFMFECLKLSDKLFSEPWMTNPDYALQLVNRDFFPTEQLVQYLQDQQNQAWIEIDRLLEETRRGRFNPQNPIQKDLEFINYIKKASNIGVKADYGSFISCKYDDSETRLPALSADELMEARAAAYEAALFAWFVAERVSMGRRVMVVGNERYGKLFVTEPLRPFLEKLGIEVTSCYVHSGTESAEHELNLLKEQVMESNPENLIIVDGTVTPLLGKDYRFPRSMCDYREWVKDLGKVDQRKYKITHYLPKPTKKIVLGNDTPELFIKPDDSTFQVILANPVIAPGRFRALSEELKEHSPAYFDDPNHKAGTKNEIVFGPYGIRVLTERHVEDFTKVVQYEISQALPEMFQLTKPVS